MIKKTIYIPSFSAGSLSAEIKKNNKFKDKLPFTFWDDKYPKRYRHKYFLLTAGHSYKRMDERKRYRLENSFVLGDSGGFQIATGNLKWDTDEQRADLREKIFLWLEENSDVAMNLDIPTRLKYEGQVEQCLTWSLDNFRYFEKNQTGKTKFLNVLQGNSTETYQNWYNQVKHFNFNGWGIGGTNTIYKYYASLLPLIIGKEHLRDNCNYLHYLGRSKVYDFMLCAQIQKSFNDVGSNTQVMLDSSSPNLSSKFGWFYINYDLKSAAFKNVKIERDRDESSEYRKMKDFGFPPIIEFDNYINTLVDWDEITMFDNQIYALITLHNLEVFLQAKKQIDYFVNAPKYMREETFSKEMNKVLDVFDELIKSKDPQKTFNENLNFIHKISNTYSKRDSIKIKDTNLFKFT